MELAAEFSRAMTPDPLLPPELLPHPWPGQGARRLSQECWTALRALPEAQDTPTPLPRLFHLYSDAITAPDER
ncbi:PaaX family transcriptional regulator C-terminal domain-containing protein [Streptomyces niveus]|uniref:Transcriptional repressor PaaX-like C-terminal domain-containing protein n=1 Tax=Streptomyces niveus TaxID=193462 RepID=A0A1U9QNP3_STRNV|nr:hypothetical protein BBN63_03115 [Streptomyces niveus]